MKTCDWCEKIADNVTELKEEWDNVCYICDTCRDLYTRGRCVKCKSSSGALMHGKCITCSQDDFYQKQVRKNEIYMGVIGLDCDGLIHNVNTELDMDEYESWLLSQLSGQTYTKQELLDYFKSLGGTNSDCEYSGLLRKIWLIVKLAAAGVPIPETYKYIDTFDELLETCYAQLMKNKCKVVVADKAKDKMYVKQILTSDKLVCYKSNIFILKI